jgi:hypothetical protein
MGSGQEGGQVMYAIFNMIDGSRVSGIYRSKSEAQSDCDRKNSKGRIHIYDVWEVDGTGQPW